MNSKQGFRQSMLLLKLVPDIVWYIALTVALPLLALFILGLVYLQQTGTLFVYVITWTLLVLLVLLTRRFIQLRKTNHTKNNIGHRTTGDNHDNVPTDALPRLSAKQEWSPKDHEAWAHARTFIDTELSKNPSWHAMKDMAIEQHAMLATFYFPGNANGYLSFTLPELLLVLEETSSRYRHFIKTNIPFADSVKLASLNTVYQHRDTAERGYRVLNVAIRLIRLSNPLAAVTSEVRDHVSGKVLRHASAKMQFELKRTLLEELAQVGIDLYSGRLKVNDAELASYVSSVAIDDQQRRAKPVEALRVVLMGQSNAGKSSLVNALTHSDLAEVDLLQTTDGLETHSGELAGSIDVNFIDTQGCDGTPEQLDLCIEQATSADVIVWLAKATQPGRATDVAVLTAIDQYFTDNPTRLPPPILLVVTHIDRLRPASEWHPPYDLSAPESPKATQIAEAVSAIEATLPAVFEGSAIDVSLSADHDPYNVDKLKERLALLTGSAKSTHQNRRRLELSHRKPTALSRLKQSKNLASLISEKYLKKKQHKDQ